jgi:thioredoxin 1
MFNSGEAAGTDTVRYEITLTAEQAQQGTSKVLSRNNKRLAVNIPPGVVTGKQVKLSNALQLTDNRPGDIVIQIIVKEAEGPPSRTVPIGVIEVNDANFESEVLRSGLPVVVDFWAAWCGPCKMMSPIIEKVAEQYAGKLKFGKLNVDENPQTASQYQAMSIPTLIFFRNGAAADRSVGTIPEAELRAKIDSWL